MKVCVVCNVKKHLTEFVIARRNRDGRSSTCKECKNASVRNVPEEKLQNRREYKKKYRQLNHEREIIMSRLWRLENRQKIDSYNHRRRLKRSLFGISEASKKWNGENRSLKNVHEANHRARVKSAEGDFTLKEWQVLCDQYFQVCLRCLKSRPLTKDHVVPLSKGGVNWITNIQPLCKECNSAKGTKSTDYRWV